jgi:deazaflavin-dependent oxidoreductase (nitroreductase family)
MALPRPIVRIANAITTAAIIAGIPRPPYTRKNALVIETFGRRSGKRHRIPVGYLDDNGRIMVVVEDGSNSNWVRNALAQDGRLRIHLRGRWRSAKLSSEPNPPLRPLRNWSSNSRVAPSNKRLQLTANRVLARERG